MTDQAAPGAADRATQLPLFYRRPVPLQAAQHAGKSMRRRDGYAFAARANSVPINAVEFSLVMKHYPIVFTGTDPASPLAVLGLREDENLFVDAGGRWEAGCYVPAYVRRYPFIFLESDDHLQYTLCIDEDAGLLVDGDEQPLFVDGKPSEFTNRVLEYCTAYQGQHVFTKGLSAALAEADLLVPNRADVNLRSGERLALGGFRIVDEQRFNDLPDTTFIDWRQRGWLQFVYGHLMSDGNWAGLVERAAARAAAADG